MNQNDLNYTFLQITKGLIFLLLFTPLMVAENLLFPYVFPKTIFFRIIVEIILIFYIFLALSDKNYRPKFTYLTKAALIFLVTAIIASLFGQDIRHSFFSTLERSEGIITLIHLVALFLIIPCVFRTFSEFINLFDFLVLINFLVALYSLGQKFSLFIILPGAGHRVFGTLGNAGALSSFLLSGTFVSLALFIYKKNIKWRIFYLSAFLLNIFIIFETQTRSSILSLFLSFFILIIGFIFFSKQKNIKWLLAALLLIIISFSSLIYLNRGNALVKNNQVLLRMTTTKLTEAALEDRILTWQSGLHGFYDRPILGWGWENFNYAFNKYFDPKIYRDSGSTLYFDRAHNFIIELLVTTGLIGAISYFIIIIISFWGLLKKNSEGKGKFNHLLALVILAYLINNLFSFDWLINWLVFFLILAYADFTLISHCEERLYKNVIARTPMLSQGTRSCQGQIRLWRTIPLLKCAIATRFANWRIARNDKKRENCFSLRPRNDRTASEVKISPFIYTIIPIAIFFICSSVNIKPWLANYQLNKIITKPTSPQLALKDFDQIFSCPSCDQEAAFWLTVYAKQISLLNISTQEKLEIYKKIEKNLNQLIKKHSQNVAYLLNLLNFYNEAALIDASYVEKINPLAKLALQLSPRRPQIYFELAKSQIILKNYDQAIFYLNQASSLNSKTIEPHQKLVEVYRLAGYTGKAEEETKIIEGLGGN